VIWLLLAGACQGVEETTHPVGYGFVGPPCEPPAPVVLPSDMASEPSPSMNISVTVADGAPALLATNRMQAVAFPYGDLTWLDWMLYFSPTDWIPALWIYGGTESIGAGTTISFGGQSLFYAHYDGFGTCWYEELGSEEGELTFDGWEALPALDEGGSFVAEGTLELDLVDDDTDPEHPTTVHFSGEFTDVLFAPTARASVPD
jgi:hypothetical protein